MCFFGIRIAFYVQRILFYKPLLYSKHLARVFYFYFGEKRPALDFLHCVQVEVGRLSRQITVAVARNDGDDESEDEFVAVADDNFDESEESETAAPDVRGKDDSEEEEDPYSSMFESQQWPYDPNAGSGIYY
jgi:hypothetical protein